MLIAILNKSCMSVLHHMRNIVMVETLQAITVASVVKNLSLFTCHNKCDNVMIRIVGIDDLNLHW